jgi:hypothetical protein
MKLLLRNSTWNDENEWTDEKQWKKVSQDTKLLVAELADLHSNVSEWELFQTIVLVVFRERTNFSTLDECL